jgi:hypothetical protein
MSRRLLTLDMSPRLYRGRSLAAAGGGGGSEGHGYTVTHYVSTTGNSTSSQAVYNAAANPLTPCTFRVALAYAVAGDVVELAPGTYEDTIASGGGGTANPIFVPANDGASGDPIIFTAKYPAAYNTSNRTQLGRSDDPAAGVESCPIIGSRDYVIWDGFYFNYADGAMPHTLGIVYFGYEVVGMSVRRLRFDRTDLGTNDDGNNWTCLYFHNATDPYVQECKFYNGYDVGGGSNNESCITTYGAQNFVFEHNDFEDVTTCFYIKGTDSGDPNYGVIRYNKLTGYCHGMQLSTTLSTGTNAVEVTQNLLIGAAGGAGGDVGIGFFNASAPECRYFNVHHNTIIGGGDEGRGVVSTYSSVALNGCEFRDNIVACFVSSTQVLVNAEQALTNFTTWDYNRYYENGNTPQYFVGSTQTGIVDWRSASSRDANSTEGDPSFVNQASGDYKLAGGSPCLTGSSTSGPQGCYISGSEEIGLRASPTY